MNKILGFLLLVTLCSSGLARTVEGVDLAATIQVGDHALVLNGAGVREKFFFDIYVAALYLPKPESDVRTILNQDQPWRMLLHFLYSEVDRKQLDQGWDQGFSTNTSEAEFKIMKERLQSLKNAFPAMRKGDQAILDYLPGQGVSVSINGQHKALIAGADFSQALLSVWLGDNPVTSALKAELLGKK